MIGKSILVGFLLIFFLFPQQVERINERRNFPKQIEELNYLINRVQNAFRDGIVEGAIPNDMSYTKLATYGFSEVQVNYIDNILQAIFLEDIGFRLVKAEQLFVQRTFDSDDEVVRVKGVQDNKDYIEITRELGNKNYVEFYFYRFKRSILIKVFVHDAETTEVIWSDRWSVETRKSNFVTYVDFSLSLISLPLEASIWNSQLGGVLNASLSSLNYNILGLFLGGRQVGFGDYGVRIKLGYESDLTYVKNGNFLFAVGPQLNLNLLEIAKIDNYRGLSVYLAFDASLFLSFPIFSEDLNKQLFIPQTILSASLGTFVVIDSLVTIGFYFDYLLLDITVAFGLKF